MLLERQPSGGDPDVSKVKPSTPPPTRPPKTQPPPTKPKER